MQSVLFLVLLAFISLVYSQSCPRCTPYCLLGDGTTKTCGGDGCGNSCGTCSSGQECCRGVCACSPNCVGRVCGDDGCGYQSCGQCSGSQTCSNGQCVGTGSPQCSGKVCGSDNNGGNCGSCPAGQRCRQGNCQCYYNCDDANCGLAVQDAGANTALCPPTSCGSCPIGFSCTTAGLCSAIVPCVVNVQVQSCINSKPLGVSSVVAITQSTTYSFSLQVSGTTGNANWTIPNTGSFTFVTSASGWLTNTQTVSITASTTSVIICLNPGALQVDVRNTQTNTSITVPATITYTGPEGPGTFRWTGVMSWTDDGFGSYTFTATPDSTYTVGTLTYQVTSTSTLIIIYVNVPIVTVFVNDCNTGKALSVSSQIVITASSSYSFTLNVGSSGSASWTTGGAMTYQFATSATGYLSSTSSVTVALTSTNVTVCLSPSVLSVDVRNTQNNQSIEVGATVSYTGVGTGSFRWNGVTSWTISGFGSYSFTATPDSKYTVGTLTTTVTASTTLIIIYVNVPTVTVHVNDCTTNKPLTVSSQIVISATGYSFTLNVGSSGSASWTTGGAMTYQFATSAVGYLVSTSSVTVAITTSSVTVCLNPALLSVDVRNQQTNQSIAVGATVSYTGAASGSFRWNGVTSWNVLVYGSYSFTATPDSTYTVGTLTTSVTTSTTLIIIYVNVPIVTVTVNSCSTGKSLGVSSSALITSGSYSFTLSVGTSGSASWTTGGAMTYQFSTSASGYSTSTTTQVVAITTTQITLCLSPNVISIDVRDISTNISINVSAAVNYTGVATGVFTWNGIYQWTQSGYGTYTFMATPSSIWGPSNNTAFQITSSTTSIILYVAVALYCGDGVCSPSVGENAENCPLDCIGLYMEFENADGSGPVNGPTVNYYATDPRTYPQATGPEKNNNVLPISTRTTGNASNTVFQDVFNYNVPIYVETIQTGFITFYWISNISVIYRSVGAFTLRAHLSNTFTATSYNYRFVNTWRTTDNEPPPYAPTTLDLTLFHPNGPLDINNPALIVGGIQIGNAVANSKQSGGPATMDISPGAGIMIAVWDAKPPRNPILAPSQAGRYLVDSGSYIVVYGKTSDASTGKQLGQVVIVQNDSNTVSDVWYAMQATISKPAQDQPTIVAQNKFQVSTIDSNFNMFYNCEAYAYCVDFEIPYADTGR